MRKIILGLTIMIITPFIILFGNYIIIGFKFNSNVTDFACVMGAITVIINYIFAILLIFKGHQEKETFKGW